MSNEHEAPAACWQPIGTAPRDETHVIIWNGDLVAIGFWSTIMVEWRGWDDCAINPAPTHWMPLPQPPTEAPKP